MKKPRTRPFEVPDDGPRPTRTSVIEYTSFVTVPVEAYDTLALAFESLVADFGARVHALGGTLHEPRGMLRDPNSAEAIYLPRRIHLRRYGYETWVCNTSHVSLKNVTDDPQAVTCRLCLRTPDWQSANARSRSAEEISS